MSAIDELKDLLCEDIRQLGKLADILGQEKSCLSSSDVQQLDNLTRQKNTLLDQIRDRAGRKIRVLVAMGFNPKAGNPSRFIRSTGMQDLTALWEEAERQLKECQQQNANNGRVLSHLQKRLSRLTEIFRGASGQQQLYGAQGQQTRVSNSNVLASA
jgi:flagella synthesis protein FlgN